MPDQENDPHIEVMFKRREEEFSYSGPDSRLSAVLARLGFEAKPPTQTRATYPEDTPDEQPDEDDAKKLRAALRYLWRGLQPDAKPIVRAIATHAPDIDFEALQEEMGLSGQAIGGRLSSLGHQLRRVRGLGYELPEIVERDYNGRRYIIDPEIAAIILELSEADS